MENMELAIKEFKTALLQINRIKATEIFEKLYENGNAFSQLEIIAISSLEEIGEGWENGSISLSQVYMSGVICEELIDKYLPKLEVKRKAVPKMAIAVLLDHHALGKRIVYSVLRAGGFEVLDFGQGLNIDELVHKTIENKIDVLLVSTLMLPSALKVKDVKEKLTAQGSTTKIIAGGAPFRLDKNLWQSVGADADGKNASNIISIVEALSKGGR
jgi:methanogenic corrinoid protein MtbC1